MFLRRSGARTLGIRMLSIPVGSPVYHYDIDSHGDPVVNVYTDGSCRNNQNPELAQAGAAVFFGVNDPRNYGFVLTEKPTNNRAELISVREATRIILSDLKEHTHTKFQIMTDSRYVIGCLTQWYHRWQSNGWRNRKGKSVANQDEIRAILANVQAINTQYANIGWGPLCFKHVYGHSGIYGNEMADQLATASSGIALAIPEAVVSDTI
ncbi:hypothetical protein KL930_003093 [Ogataea haglerorum]|uniref:ribonuclease H n=1 Tax=Ogataea haglerorum TaxID=1937702 RepID=A0AAN6D3A6_9ASCO|nr:uncharacterized protein KL911_002653 [Ogataea haglerorum]KAG7696438.1 hypothetical protein KL951_002894 [Ogataea haglerorum]KAG7707117.1 hypothetical protein KL914_003001 [Ogataea haglerorum]KAG7708575.1 hypothetical protein KL950_002095 [Ogataea haglerorum]KAG7713745.1 hypothetical protein KL913_004769 [Ogataea haglerorum]KAG7714178.1 hypothetical protein KL949_004808 [Ogataea haglerorum]